jgi:hypothetical protein
MPSIRKLATKYNIELILVPCSMTSTLAPLDVGKDYIYIYFACAYCFFFVFSLITFVFLFFFFFCLAVNGVLKSIYSKHWRMIRLFKDDKEEKTLPWAEAVQEAHHAYQTLTSHTIKVAFTHAVHFPPPSSLSLRDAIANEEKMKKQLEKREREDNPPIAPSRCSERISSTLADACINDSAIALAYSDYIDEFE